MSLPKEVIEALDAGTAESQEYRVEESWIGWILYKNLVDSPQYRSTFYPYSKAGDPIVAEPITSSIIDRLVSALRKGTDYSAQVNGQDATQELQTLLTQLNWDRLNVDALTKTLATGGQLFWLSLTPSNLVSVSPVQPYYAGKVFNPHEEIQAYYQSYSADTRTMLTPIDSYSKNNAQTIMRYVDDTSYIKWVNGQKVVDQAHNLPFIPAVWADNIDMDENGTYGVPYSNRFKSLLLHLNATLSQKQKALVFLQNIWVAKTDRVPTNDGEELVLRPDVINYISPDGSLEQAIRNLDLSEESNQIQYIKKAIYKSAQVPNETDLSSQGKLESGVALRILYAQLEEVVTRLRNMWRSTETQVLSKAFRMQRLANGQSDPGDGLTIEVKYDQEIIPQDEQHRLDIDLRLLENNLITRESLIRKYNKSKLDIQTLLTQTPPPVSQTPPPSGDAV